MLWGKRLVLDMDTMIVPLKSDYNDNLPLKKLLFNSNIMYSKDRTYKQILKEGEDKNINGNKGMYFMHPDFGLTILFNMSSESMDDSMVQMMLDEIDHIDKFKKIYITQDQ